MSYPGSRAEQADRYAMDPNMAKNARDYYRSDLEAHQGAWEAERLLFLRDRPVLSETSEHDLLGRLFPPGARDLLPGRVRSRIVGDFEYLDYINEDNTVVARVSYILIHGDTVSPAAAADRLFKDAVRAEGAFAGGRRAPSDEGGEQA